MAGFSSSANNTIISPQKRVESSATASTVLELRAIKAAGSDYYPVAQQYDNIEISTTNPTIEDLSKLRPQKYIITPSSPCRMVLKVVPLFP
jgi:hypothetical protein